MNLRTRLLVQCLIDAKLKGLENYYKALNTPDSYVRVLLESIGTVMERELKNLAKRMNKKYRHITDEKQTTDAKNRNDHV